jgi:hypothetical protein
MQDGPDLLLTALVAGLALVSILVLLALCGVSLHLGGVRVGNLEQPPALHR